MKRLLPGVTVLLLAMLVAAADEDKKEGDSEKEPDEPMVKEPIGNLLPMQNVGGHTERINDMVFDPAGKRLYTAGPPGEVAEWALQLSKDKEGVERLSGERLRVWRFPRPVKRLAMFPDGERLAVVGQAGVWMIELAKGEAALWKKKELPASVYRALAIAPDGRRLAVGVSRNTEVHDIADKMSRVVLTGTNLVHTVAFDCSGRWLLLTEHGHTGGKVRVWDPSSKPSGKGKEGKQGDVTLADAALHLPQATWSADGAHVIGIGGGKGPSLAVWKFGESSRTKLDRKMDPGQLKLPVTAKSGYYALGVASLPDDEVLAAWASIDHGRTTGSLKLVRVGLKKDQVSTLPTAIQIQSKSSARMAVSADGRWLAVTTSPAFRVVLYDLKKEREVGRLGPTTHVPRAVAWTQTRKGYGIAWGYQARLDRKDDGKTELNEGLDMGQLEPLSLEALAAAQVGARLGKRSISISDKDKIYLIRGGKKVQTHHIRDVLPKTARLYKDKAGVERLIVAHATGGRLSIVDFDTGRIITSIGGNYSRIYDVSVSPDQKYVLVAGGGMELQVFALADPRKPLLRLTPGWRGKASEKENEPAQSQKLRQTIKPGGDWVAWTEQGYYAGTPGGEKLFGWKVVSASDRLAAFHPASRFRKQLYRPELIKLVLAKGSVEAALKEARRNSAELDQGETAQVKDLLPPTVVIESVDTSKLPTVTIKAKVKGAGPTQPVVSLRLMLNGRPLPEQKFEVDLDKGKAEHSQSWTLEVPEGKSELSVLARGPDSLGVSEAKEVSFKQPPASRLFALCVGVNTYAEPKFNLKAAGNDAKAIAAALKKNCGNPLFASADAELRLDADATKKGVLDALTALRDRKVQGKPIKPSDLVVLFFAGHGVKEGRNFYLLPHDANLKDLPKTCISGDELRKALSRFPCQVLLLLDACHSGSVGGALTAYRPATDDLTRTMTSEEVGVVVLAAAMGHESALEKGSRGFFARALEEAIERKPGVAGVAVPCNFRDKHIYVHHLFTYAFDRVKDFSDDQQHPSLNLPDTVESFPLVP